MPAGPGRVTAREGHGGAEGPAETGGLSHPRTGSTQARRDPGTDGPAGPGRTRRHPAMLPADKSFAQG